MPIKLKTSIKFPKPATPYRLSGIEMPDTVEHAAAVELTEVQRTYREAARREREAKAEATDSRHYIVLCFGSAARAKAYADARGLALTLDCYADGEEAARIDKIPLPELKPIVGRKSQPLRDIELIRRLTP